MIDQLTNILVDQAKAAVRKGAAFAAIAVVMLVGAGFLLAAIYMAIAASFGAIAAAMAIGGTMVTLGLVALAIMLQRDPGDAVDPAAVHDDAARRRKTEDDMLFDLLVHSAMTGYATGQGNKPRMQSGFDKMVTDLAALGIFDPPKGHMETQEAHHDLNTKKAG